MPSSVVTSFSYKIDKRTLKVVYTSGAVYDYIGVEEYVYEQMKQAESKGAFLNMVIKPKYPFRKVN